MPVNNSFLWIILLLILLMCLFNNSNDNGLGDCGC